MKNTILINLIFFLTLWLLVSWLCGPELFPWPWLVAPKFLAILGETKSLLQIAITCFRSLAGLALALLLGTLLTLPCLLKHDFRRWLGPSIAAIQSSPVVIWVTLSMVYLGTGSAVPIVAITIAIFPVVFLNLSNGVLAVDSKLLQMAKLYRVPFTKQLRQIYAPALKPALRATFAYGVSVTWKVCSTAEFISTSDGIGAQVFWSFRMLDMPSLFAWGSILIILGVLTDQVFVRALRHG